jgi:hypothetical protein
MAQSMLTDRDKDRIIGAVKMIHTESVSLLSDTDGEAEESLLPVHTVIYNEVGNKAKEAFYTPDGQPSEILLFKYDIDGKIIETARHKAGGGLLNYTVYTYNKDGKESGRSHTSTYGLITKRKSVVNYDESGNKVEETWYLDDGTCIHKYLYVYGSEKSLTKQILYKYADDGSVEEESHSIYDSDRNVTEHITFDRNGHLSENRYIYIFDSRGNEIKRETYNPDGSLYSEALFNYDFDEIGNWIRQKEICETFKIPGHRVSLTRRTISYF